MTIPRLIALSDYWRDHPPLRDMIQAFLGAGTDGPARAQGQDAEEFFGQMG